MLFTLYMFILCVSAIIMSFSITFIAQFFLKLTKVEDTPSERSNHSEPVPRGGGLGIILPLIGFMFVTGADSTMLWAAIGLAIISFKDDLAEVDFRSRLIVQVAAVILSLMVLDGMVFQGLLPFWADRFLAGILLLGFLNLYNFMDGIDGIAASQTIAIGLGFIGLSFALPIMKDGVGIDGALLICCSLGFLYFNWHPAKTFMGDVGSVTLGLIVGYSLLQLAADGYWASAAILPAYYLVDGGITFLKRAFNREPVWQAHSQHAYQQAVRKGYGHDVIVKKIAYFNLFAVLLAIIAAFDYGPVAVAIAYAGAGVLMVHLINLPHNSEVIAPPKKASTDSGSGKSNSGTLGKITPKKVPASKAKA